MTHRRTGRNCSILVYSCVYPGFIVNHTTSNYHSLSSSLASSCTCLA